MTGPGGLSAPLRHRDYRLSIAAFTFAGVGGWAYSVALTVWVFQETGDLAWVSAAAVVRFIPSLLFGAYAGVIADRFEKTRVMRGTDLACAVVMLALAAVMFLGAPVLAAILLAAVASTISQCYEPAAAGLTPLLVLEPELASANALRNTIDNATIIVGPGLGAGLLVVASAEVAVLVNAAAFLLSALCLAAIRTRSRPVDVTEGGDLGAFRQMLVGVRAMGSSSTTAVMVGYSTLATFAYGIDTVLFVAVAEQKLGQGADGYGYLLAGLGVGGILAAPLVSRAGRSRRLGPVIIAGMAAYCLPTMVYLVSGSLVIAVAAQVLRGAGTMFVDVLADTALQRSLPKEVISRVWGALGTTVILAILLGSATASALVATVGVDATIWVSGLGIFCLSLLGLPALMRADRAATRRRAELAPRVAVLARCAVLESAGDGDLTELAGGAEEMAVAAGTTVVAEGEPADAFYVVLEGTLTVETGSTGTPIPDLVPGDHFGEIGLVQGWARTASVTAATDAVLLRVPGADFVDALTAYKPSVVLRQGVAARLRRTHPTAPLPPSLRTSEEEVT